MEWWLSSAFKEDWMPQVILSLSQIKVKLLKQKIYNFFSKCVAIILKFVTSLELLQN